MLLDWLRYTVVTLDRANKQASRSCQYIYHITSFPLLPYSPITNATEIVSQRFPCTVEASPSCMSIGTRIHLLHDSKRPPNGMDMLIGDHWLVTYPKQPLAVHPVLSGLQSSCMFSQPPYSIDFGQEIAWFHPWRYILQRFTGCTKQPLDLNGKSWLGGQDQMYDVARRHRYWWRVVQNFFHLT